MTMNFSKRTIFAKKMKSNHCHRQPVLISITLLVMCALYLLFSVGIIKATHFCMGREASVAYFTSESKKCPCSLFAKERNNCCDDTRDLLKLEDSQKTLSAFELHFPDLTLLGELYSAATVDVNSSPGLIRTVAEDEQPPPKILFKIHCSFVFYDKKSIA